MQKHGKTMETLRRLTAAQVAELQQVTHATALRWIRTGQLTAYKLPNGSYRVTPESLERFETGKRELK